MSSFFREREAQQSLLNNIQACRTSFAGPSRGPACFHPNSGPLPTFQKRMHKRRRRRRWGQRRLFSRLRRCLRVCRRGRCLRRSRRSLRRVTFAARRARAVPRPSPAAAGGGPAGRPTCVPLLARRIRGDAGTHSAARATHVPPRLRPAEAPEGLQRAATCVPLPARRIRGEAGTRSAARATRCPSPAAAGGAPPPPTRAPRGEGPRPAPPPPCRSMSPAAAVPLHVARRAAARPTGPAAVALPRVSRRRRKGLAARRSRGRDCAHMYYYWQESAMEGGQRPTEMPHEA